MTTRPHRAVPTALRRSGASPVARCEIVSHRFSTRGPLPINRQALSCFVSPDIPVSCNRSAHQTVTNRLRQALAGMFNHNTKATELSFCTHQILTSVLIIAAVGGSRRFRRRRTVAAREGHLQTAIENATKRNGELTSESSNPDLGANNGDTVRVAERLVKK